MHKTFFLKILFLVFLAKNLSDLYGQTLIHYKDKVKNYLVAGKYQEAVKIAEEALKFAEEKYSSKDPNFEEALSLLSEVHEKAGNIDSAIYFTDLILKFNISRLSDTLPEFASLIGTTCTMFRYYLDKNKGLNNLKKAIKVVKNIKSVDYSIITELTNIYADSFKTDNENNLSVKESDDNNIKQQYGKFSNEYLNFLENKHKELKQKYEFGNAIPVLKEIIEIKLKLKEDKDTTIGGNYFDLATNYYYTFKYDSAKLYYEKAIEYWSKYNGKNLSSYALSLYNWAIVEYTNTWIKNQHDFYKYKFVDESEILKKLLEAEPLILKHFGKESSLYNSITLYIASIYMRQGNLLEAEKYYKKNLEIEDKTDSLGYKKQAALWGLGSIYVQKNDYAKAELIYTKLNDITFRQIRSMFDYVAVPSEKKVSQFFIGYNYSINWYYSFFYERAKQNPALTTVIYDNELVKKGMILRVMKHKLSSILNSGDTSLINLLHNWLKLRQQLSKLYLLPISERKVNVNFVEKRIQEVENSLFVRSWNIREKLRMPSISWKEIRQKLKTNEAAIEFVSFDYLSWGKTWMKDSTIYFALINKKGLPYPKLIPLFSGSTIEKLLKSIPGENDYEYVASLYSTDTLYKLIWQPLEKELKDVTTIYYSPTGVLHKISFPALVDEKGILLVDKYNLNRLTTTAYLYENKEPLKFKSDFETLFYGGILYDLDSSSTEDYVRKFKHDFPDYFIRDRSFEWSDSLRSGTYWPYLEGTLIEAEKLAQVVKAKTSKTTLITKGEALEESLKEIRKSPDILHVATHGFFFPEFKETNREPIITTDESSDPTIVFKNPLLRSGLIFAGANHVWTGNPPKPGIEDGILTAYEVSTLNLFNTKLVVLSACETGLGEIKGSEGVYGLQRAFKIAGVDYIIMSLWQIPDEQTVELMECFYKNWLEGDDIKTAFNKAQSTMRKKYNPYYWAAFVLLE